MQNKTPDIPIENVTQNLSERILEFLNLGLHFGEGEKSIHITIGLLLLLGVAFVVTSFVLKWFTRLFTRKMDVVDKLKFSSVFRFVKYLIYMVVILITMSAAGIDITLIITASAALFVGLGLALQELFQDIIGGLSIILDKSLSVGDVIDMNGRIGKVIEIKLRTTRAITRDDKIIVIPNHKFVSDVVYNYTQNHITTRESVKVGVAYGSDVELVSNVLLQILKQHKGVLKKPLPFILFEDFGDSALIFTANFYTNDSFKDPKLKSDLRFEIFRAFKENGITIPFPQRDVHLFQQK